MKTPRYPIGTIWGALALGGLLMIPMNLTAQETDKRQTQPVEPHQREAAKDTPNAKRFQPILREMEELLQAGKFDEILQRIERIRNIAKDNPQVMDLIGRAMGEHKQKSNAARPNMEGPGEADPAPRARIQHLRVAAEHLNAAGYEKLADQARAAIGRITADAQHQQAERQQAERRQAERRQAESARAGGPEANSAMKEEMNKLQRELEDLRNQLRHLKADAAPQFTPKPPLPPKHATPPPEQPGL